MNPIYDYLENSAGVKLSIKTLSKRLNMKKKKVLYYCYKDSRIRKVKGLEVGTGKVRLNIFTVDQ
jgi:hypothetical protein|tara:strand:- start:2130 stop:2324 length:195 start_codon:yes stop_codon:yes gene_type:complete